MTKEELQFQKRLIELAQMSWQRGVPCFSDFMGLNEQNIYHATQKQIGHVPQVLFGGYEAAERQMAGFFPDALSDSADDFGRYALSDCADSFGSKAEETTAGAASGAGRFPIACLKIVPVNAHFAQSLTHRDYLGAILNLGIERAKCGDIVIGEQSAWLFCEEKISAFLQEELHRVNKTVVTCSRIAKEENLPAPRTQNVTGTVTSPRIDALLPIAFAASRTSLSGLAEGGKIFINGRLVTDKSTQVQAGDMVSVRGFGRFCYLGINGESRKGRLFVTLQKYI